MTVVRDKNTSQMDFVRYSNRVMRLLAEEAITLLPSGDVDVQTACGVYKGVAHPMLEKNLCAVRISCHIFIIYSIICPT